MGYKNLTKGSTTKLSKNFTAADFHCQGIGCCTSTLVNEDLVDIVQNIRDHFNTPVTVTSGYRCTRHNSEVGGASGSRHTKGDAADIQVKGVTPRAVAQYAESIGVKGIGLYESASDGHFVHVDTRTAKSFWYGQGQAARTTFGASTATTASASNDTSGILRYGDSGDAVKELQQNLIDLGYACGNADGEFGTATRTAVKKFQSDRKLSSDGIVGNATKTALSEALKSVKTASAGRYKVTASLLNVRNGAGVNYLIVKVVEKGKEFDITEVQNGWGKLNNETGWICLDFAEKI